MAGGGWRVRRMWGVWGCVAAWRLAERARTNNIHLQLYEQPPSSSQHCSAAAHQAQYIVCTNSSSTLCARAHNNNTSPNLVTHLSLPGHRQEPMYAPSVQLQRCLGLAQNSERIAR
jgi:hypothetical protein